MKKSQLLSAAILGLASALIGWEFAGDAPPVPENTEAPTRTRERTRNQVPQTFALERTDSERRLAEILRLEVPRDQMRATIHLANSIPTDEIADWLGTQKFTLSQGLSGTIFAKILEKRWKVEDPESFVAWRFSAENAGPLRWSRTIARDQPEAFLAGLLRARESDDRNAQSAFEGLGLLAEFRPDLAIPALKELGKPTGDPLPFYAQKFETFKLIAQHSPAALKAALPDLDGPLKTYSVAALAANELQHQPAAALSSLAEVPDGYLCLQLNAKLFSEGKADFQQLLKHLPDQWRTQAARELTRFIPDNKKSSFLSTDWEDEGFSSSDSLKIRQALLSSIRHSKPEKFLEALASREDWPAQWKLSQLQNLHRYQGRLPEKTKTLLHDIAGPELLSQFQAQKEASQLTREAYNNPTADNVANLIPQSDDPASFHMKTHQFVNSVAKLSAEELQKFQDTYLKQGHEQREKVMQALLNSHEEELITVRARIVKELLNDGGIQLSEQNGKDHSAQIIRAASRHSLELMKRDPREATRWVATLPSGTEKAWIHKNLYDNWKTYDPTAADKWLTQLPPAERDGVEKLSR
ncbi:MAG: hypothetical protein ACQKBY_07920 [Verrucomicrobiales bacterium]